MKKVLFLLFAGMVGWMIWTADDERKSRINQATTPEQLAIALVDGGRVQATFDNGALEINRTIDAALSAGWTVSGFNVTVAHVVPAVFAKFPQVDSIIFRESGPFKDIRGNESTEEMLRIAFMRGEAELIHWDKIVYDDVPKLGEHYWMHPGLRRVLQ
ncbi:hypothetical protein [Bradyrhizobium sp. HKCCYLS1011]|uniref:hypothetical protein n=1 Tax=Bradyrhizobium sp. HKCCYLS1011 TaxID=3420733 RepID=UPI003EBE0C48